MDVEIAKMIAPKVKEIEDAWGKPLEDFEKLCIAAGYELRMDHESKEIARLRKQIAEGTP
jgi:hypothetical protein